MESRDIANQPKPGKGELVPAEVHRLPLLPYERDLISSLGLSEEEYRAFAAEVSRKLQETSFEGKPVAGAVLVPLLISVVVGVVMSLLAPKPKQQEDNKKSIKLADEKGRSRFNESRGFDGAPELAQLGSRIAIPFGMYVPDSTDPNPGLGEFNQSGGIVVEPLLVWSRMTSHGKFQTMKFLTVLGTSRIATPPQLPGIMFGGQTLANMYETNYWVGWKSLNDSNIIQLDDTLYGRAAEGNNSGDGIFICPTLDSPAERGFSQVHTPSNTTSFGLYEALHNGGNWRLNWQIQSFQEDAGKDIDNKVQNERKKIAGNNAKKRADGMRGTGRAYGTRCGLVSLNGQQFQLPTEVEVNIGDNVAYQISSGQYDFDNSIIGDDSGVQIGDLNSRIDSIREAADETLQLGVVLLCNRTLLRVIHRPSDVWHPDAADMYYELKVIGFTGANRMIGIAGLKNVDEYIHSEGGDQEPYEWYKGTGWYTITKLDVGQVKNTRPVEVTEIGIRSQVWNQANGLANFNVVPSAAKLRDYDEDSIQVSMGTISKYMKRTAFFVLAVRDPNNMQGVNPDGGEASTSDQYLEGYDIIDGVTFAVTGNKPVDQFSWIRIRHPKRIALEYRLIPKPSTTMLRFREGQPKQIYVLRGSAPMRGIYIDSNAYGPFQLDFAADVRNLDELYDLPEMTAGLQKVPAVVDCSDISYEARRDTPAQGGGQYQAWLESLDGGQWNLKPTSGNGNKNLYGQTRTDTIRCTQIGGRQAGPNGMIYHKELKLRVQGTVVDAGGEARLASHGTAKAWAATFYLIEEEGPYGDKPEDGERYEHTRNVYPTHHANWFNTPQTVTQTFEVVGDGQCRVIRPGYEKEREFEDNAAIKEISPYQEVSKSCDSGPEFNISYINESVGCDPKPNWYGMTVAGFKVRSLNTTTSFNQPQIWLPNGIDVERLGPADEYKDNRGITGPTNNFADIAYYLLTASGPGSAAAGRTISPELVDKESFIESAKFIANYWMRYDGAIYDAINLRDYLTETSPSFMCNFVVMNGKFALKPALPVDSNGMLDEGPIPTQMFNDGNIIAESFKLTYLPQSERQDFRANMIYRLCQPNTLVEKRSILVQWDWDENNDDDPSNNVTTVNQEDFDISAFCTRRSHAAAVARYMLSLRRRVDHTIEFKTNPTGLSLAPGDFIRVESTASPYEEFRNGMIGEDGEIRTPSPLEDGEHTAYVYKGGDDDVREVVLSVKDNRIDDPELFGSLFNAPGITRRLGCYQIESIGIEEDGAVKVTASHHPVTEDLRSRIVQDVLNEDRFVIVEEVQT